MTEHDIRRILNQQPDPDAYRIRAIDWFCNAVVTAGALYFAVRLFMWMVR